VFQLQATADAISDFHKEDSGLKLQKKLTAEEGKGRLNSLAVSLSDERRPHGVDPAE